MLCNSPKLTMHIGKVWFNFWWVRKFFFSAQQFSISHNGLKETEIFVDFFLVISAL